MRKMYSDKLALQNGMHTNIVISNDRQLLDQHV